ncbi:MAG TPA: hypothetical protein VLH84_03495 [Patescibacteria group bacterium]|nr:hypothetical protein [Patescibacteria group bacterium]
MAKKTAPAKAKTKKAPSAKTPAVQPVTAVRRLRLPKRKHVPRKLRKQAQAGAKLPSAFKIFWAALKILRKNWKLFLGMLVIYAILRLIFSLDTSEFSTVTTAKTSFTLLAHGHWSALFGGVATFAYLLGGGTNGTGNPSAGIYEIMFGIMLSLAFIWALRQAYAEHRFRVRDAFYRGMYPLVPFVLTLLLIGIQLLPMVVGILLYVTVVNNGIIVSGFEQVGWGFLAFLLSVWSLYIICPTILSLYAVCLPDATPWATTRAVRQVARLHRWAILRKMLFLPIALLLGSAILTVPFILFLTVISPWIFFLVSMLALLVAHSYLYGLYRSLL